MASDTSSNTPKTPGQYISDALEARGWNQRVLAIVLDLDRTAMNKVISDKKLVTAQLAVMLEEVLGVSAEKLLRLQSEFELAKAKYAARPDPNRATRAQLFGDLPLTEMIRRGWLHAPSVRDVTAVETALTTFFGTAKLDEVPILRHAAKKSLAETPATPAQLAWLWRVKQIAEEMLVPQFSQIRGHEAVRKLHSLLTAPEETRKVPRIMAEAGIRYVIVESLSSAKIDGVCFWLDESPVIGMSLRFDRLDNFWFVLRHELEHVLRGHGRTVAMLDIELEGEKAGADVPDDEERVANQTAAEFCVPQDKLDGFIARKAPFFREKDLLGFAGTIGVHPGLVAGQIQHRTGRYNQFRNHLSKVRAIVAPNATVDGWGDVAPLGE